MQSKIEFFDQTPPASIVLDTLETRFFIGANVSGDCTLELRHPGATAIVIILNFGTTDNVCSLNITQKHLATKTTSHVFVRSLLFDQSVFRNTGVIHIGEKASGSTATLETRGLLLSPEARFQTIPSLEILPSDVTCHHRATAAPLSPEEMRYLHTRGLVEGEAKALLTAGFIQKAQDFFMMHCADPVLQEEFSLWLQNIQKKYHV
jgi:Fe-S cluster assembly scaffold protein SufB